MQKNSTYNKYLMILWIISLIGIVLTYAHHGNLIIDNGREAYYPTQVLLGKVLYKDIFNVYGPMSYMLNAFLFKIFGINLNILYFSGIFCTFGIVYLIFTISKKFLSEFLSFSIGILTISVGLTYSGLFNFIFPYSYSILYGILAFLASVLFLLKYEKKTEKMYYLYLSCFLGGICVTNKYEFIPYLAVILYSMIKIKPLNVKEHLFCTLSIFLAPIMCFGILFLQGLRFSDLALTIKHISNMTHGQALKNFYSYSGVYFCKKTLGLLATKFFQTSIFLFIFVFSFSKFKKYFSIPIIIVTSIYMFNFTDPVVFVFVPVLILLFTISNFKSLLADKKLFILALSGITISLKIFWGLATLNYGVFFISFLLITLFALIINILKGREINQKPIAIFLLIVAMFLGYKNIQGIKQKNYCIKTGRGVICVDESFYQSTFDLIKYIDKKTKTTDKILILPEGAMINFLTNRSTDNVYVSLIPPYIDAFGEKNIIEHFKKDAPDYIIFNNWNSQDYGFSYICKDYATSFCQYVQQNYHYEALITHKLFYLIYKKN